MARPLFTFNSKNLPKAFLLALSLILSGYIIELILPLNFFTFRFQEALIVYTFDYALPGPFYPNVRMSMVEEGDLAEHTKLAVKKYAEWQTDRYGYRNKDNNSAAYKIVIIGDSNSAGVSLTQEDMLSEVLERKLRMSVYSLAPADINIFLNSQRFIDNPPEIVIFECVERDILHMPEVKSGIHLAWYKKILGWVLKKNPPLTILLDRLSKNAMYRYLWARFKQTVNEMISNIIHLRSYANTQTNPGQRMLFYQGVEANKDVPEQEIERVSRIIKTYDEILKSKGMRFIFLPIPNKENIYYDLLPDKKRPVFLEKLISRLRSMGIEVVDTQRAFEKAYREKGAVIYHVDDGHWNANGVKLTAGLIDNLLKH